MYQIDNASAAATLQAPAAAGSPGYFQDQSNPGTILPADWLNMVQEEILNVVAAAAIAPSKTTYTQLRDAIRLLIELAGYAVDTGVANAIAASLTPAPTALVAGLEATIKIAASNTGATTLDLNGLGAAAVRFDGAALPAGALLAGQIYSFVYDGAEWQLLNASLSPPSAVARRTYVAAVGGFSWTVPAGVTEVRSRQIGGGGGGAAATSIYGGGGGGAGGRAEKLWAVTPGQDFTGGVGAAGAGGTSGNGGAGGTTTVTYGGVTVTTTGGGGGQVAGVVAGGGGGAASGGDLDLPGGDGGDGSENTYFAAGNGAPGWEGAGAGRTGAGGGIDATAYGAGGGGAYNTSGAGGDGFSGLVVFEY